MPDSSDNGPDMNKDWSAGIAPGAEPEPEAPQPSWSELPGTPFREKTNTVIFFPDEATAGTLRNRLTEGQDNIGVTFMPEDSRWRSHYEKHFRTVEYVLFIINGDSDFSPFAKAVAKVLCGSYKKGRLRLYRTVKIVETPEGFDIAKSDLTTFFDLLRDAPKYRPPQEPDQDHDNQDEDDPEPRQDEPAPAFPDRSKKLEAIDKWRKDQTAKGKTPPTFTGRTFDGKAIKRAYVDHWWYCAIICNRPKDERLSAVELAAAAIIKSTLLGPWAFECWPGPGRAAKCSTMAKTTWLRNRDNLEKRGLIELEHFGNGAAPIIYPIVPGLAYRSIFAPSNKAARKKKKGDDE